MPILVGNCAKTAPRCPALLPRQPLQFVGTAPKHLGCLAAALLRDADQEPLGYALMLGGGKTKTSARG
jgi:hypothetical protein